MDNQEYWTKITQLILIINIIIIALYDTFVMYHVGRQATITDVVYQISCRWPIVPCVVGAVIGHLFWR